MSCVPVFLLALLLWAAGASGARAQGFLLWESNGAAAGDALGTSVAAAGDLDGDGVFDVLLGAPRVDPGGLFSAGSVEVRSGASGLLLFVVPGVSAGDQFGSSVSGVSDLNGDGVPDLAAGAPWSAPTGLPLGGSVEVLSGANGASLFTLLGTLPDGLLGSSVADAGDVNGDGLSDVVAGGPSAPYAIVFSGANGLALHTLLGPAFSCSFGQAVAGLGDVDGDGFDDVAIGADDCGSGFVFVHSGSSGTLLYTLSGSAVGDHFGAALARSSDLNGDGVAEILVGAPRTSPAGVTDAGRAAVFSGASGAPLFSMSGVAPTDFFGWAVAGIADASGDSVPDLLVGAPECFALGGCSFATCGGGRLELRSGAGGSLLASVSGGPGASRFGASVASPGDLDGDGVPDLLVGAPCASPGALAEAGQARAISVVGIPPGSVPFGVGCAGSAGLTPLIQTAGGAPSATTGNPKFSIVLSNALPNAPALLLAGISNSFWAAPGLPLPVNLAAVGFPNCSLAVSVEVQIAATTSAGGLAFVPVPVPANAALAGQSVFFQWFVLDPPGAMTQGLQVVL
jgi:hypothetical protein